MVELLVVVQAVAGSSPVAHPSEVPGNLHLSSSSRAAFQVAKVPMRCQFVASTCSRTAVPAAQADHVIAFGGRNLSQWWRANLRRRDPCRATDRASPGVRTQLCSAELRKWAEAEGDTGGQNSPRWDTDRSHFDPAPGRRSDRFRGRRWRLRRRDQRDRFVAKPVVWPVGPRVIAPRRKRSAARALTPLSLLVVDASIKSRAR